MNEIIFFKIQVCSKSIEIETVFTKTEMNNEWNVNFLQNSYLGIQHAYFIKFSIGWSTSETPL